MNGLITLFINPSIGSPSGFRKRFQRFQSGEANDLAVEGMHQDRAAFEDFLKRRYMNVDHFDNATNGLYMKSEKAIYQYMDAVYDYVYKDGKEPDWKDYIHPDYI
ncbi:hypothetical protein K3725_00410 [Leisingera sp. S132]|uniref:hypothetical protein n=1 Tax=Leisingera sp. S132 TaxID=2867016 RepID=UPI0021A64B97|nr:hypothetical protein [Leisingera sp. S132]UWQ79506.1 hypothetical protein K3725_00410 [Leisingera sp. S132]